MKKRHLIIFILFIATFSSCKKDDDKPISSSGTLMFWSNQNGNPIDVSIDGSSGTITSYYSYNTVNNSPDCGSSGCYSVYLRYGTYNYSASDGAHNWSGTVTLSSSCKTYLLYW